MAGIKLNFGRIFEKNAHQIGVYVPFVFDQEHEYGVTPTWHPWAGCYAWYSDAAFSDYSAIAGINARVSKVVYVVPNLRDFQNNVPLPPRVGIRFAKEDVEDAPIKPSISVENFYDFDGTYAYTVVMV